MEVNDELINRLAHLARLEFSAEEIQELRVGLKEMIGFVNKLNELDSSGTEPLLHISSNVNVLRKDEPGPCLSVSDSMKNSRFPDASYFKVPKVISK